MDKVIFIFRRKKIIPKEKFQLSSRRFLPFPDFAHDTQTYAFTNCKAVDGF